MLSSYSFSQTIDHWESVVLDNQVWKYNTPTNPMPTNWTALSFDDSAWSSGFGGFGFADNDDNTELATSVVSVFIRKTFTITDLSAIKKVIFNIDYDDGFVAYINGLEIARNGFSGTSMPIYDQFAEISHEAVLYQNGYPDQFEFDEATFLSVLTNGLNVLCVQVHNQSATSSDLTVRPFLSFGIGNTSNDYNPTPEWFSPPLSFTSSKLPIIVINTNDVEIQDEPKIDATMGVIYNGEGVENFISQSFNEFSGQIAIETRGSSSSGFPAKSYGLETRGPDSSNYNVSIFDWPSDNDWILYAPYTDKSLIRNVLTYHLGNQMGNYSPRTKLCELVLNNEYQGVYVFMERIKVNPGRVNIDKIIPADTSENELSGGYIFKIDKTTAGGIIAWESPQLAQAPSTVPIYYQLHDPEIQATNSIQLNYIQSYVSAWENALASPDFKDPQMGYRAYSEPNSFIDFMLVNELSKNVDGYRISTFLHKKRFSEGGKIVAGPLWDFNLGWGNSNYCYGGDTTGWEIDFNNYCSGGLDNPFWWKRMLEDSLYANEVNCRWFTLRNSILSDDYLINYIDSIALFLTDAATRHYVKWPILGEYVWPNNFVGNTYEEEINYLKTWTLGRLHWMDQNMFGICGNLSVSEQETESIRVFPNPATTTVFLEGFHSPTKIRLISIEGQVVLNKNVDSFQTEIDLSELREGVYFISIDNQPLKTYKVIHLKGKH